MISGPPSLRRRHPFEAELSEIERIDKRIDHSNRIVLVDPVVQTFGKQRRLCASRPLNEALHWPPQPPMDYIMRGVFTQPGSCRRSSSAARRPLVAMSNAAKIAATAASL